jgi:ComF family protein
LSINISKILNGRLNFKQIGHFFALKQPCLLCKNPLGEQFGFCNDCFAELPWHHAPHCPQCALITDGSICGQCIKSAPAFDSTISVLTYEFPANALLQHYKYQQAHYLAHTFGDLLANHLAIHQPKISAVDLVIPMPMHPTRLKERGFNQALEIARIVANTHQLPLDFESAYRIKLTPPQATLPLKERVKNMQNVFQCKRDLNGFNIAIIDDVMTSGASLNALAKTLKKAGANKVECWVIARTLPNK